MSDRLEADVRAGWRLRFDGCTDGDLAAPHHDAHDARSTDQPAIGVSIEDAIERSKQDVRNYAKRQLTWFRRENVELRLHGFGSENAVFEALTDAI